MELAIKRAKELSVPLEKLREKAQEIIFLCDRFAKEQVEQVLIQRWNETFQEARRTAKLEEEELSPMKVRYDFMNQCFNESFEVDQWHKTEDFPLKFHMMTDVGRPDDDDEVYELPGWFWEVAEHVYEDSNYELDAQVEKDPEYGYTVFFSLKKRPVTQG